MQGAHGPVPLAVSESINIGFGHVVDFYMFYRAAICLWGFHRTMNQLLRKIYENIYFLF